MERIETLCPNWCTDFPIDRLSLELARDQRHTQSAQDGPNFCQTKPAKVAIMSKHIPQEMPRVLKPGEVFIDATAIRERMNVMGFTSEEQLASKCALSRSGISRVLNSDAVQEAKLVAIAKALDISPSALQPMTTYERAQLIRPKIVPPYDWEIAEMVTVYVTAANGIAYCTAKLRSLAMPDVFARGKLYDLVQVYRLDREGLRDRLTRHARVCERFRGSKYLARHRTIFMFQEDTAWWVLDDWIDGRTLEEYLDSQHSFSHQVVGEMGLQILLGLQELHDQQIAARELTPERIYISDDFTRVTLTDFEMAKFLPDGSISVSGKWKNPSENPYRAPEHIPDSEEARFATPGIKGDIYSWAAVVIELLTGQPSADQNALQAVLGDADLSGFLVRCRSKKASLRPDSVSEVLETWRPWAEKQRTE